MENNLAQVLALAIYELGGELIITNELLDNLKPLRLMWDVETVPNALRLTISSNEMLLGTVDNEEVSVVL